MAGKGEGIDLGIILAGKPKGKGPMGMMAEEEPESSKGDHNAAFDVAADEFLDDTLPIEERKAALKRAIEACYSEA